MCAQEHLRALRKPAKLRPFYKGNIVLRSAFASSLLTAIAVVVPGCAKDSPTLGAVGSSGKDGGDGEGCSDGAVQDCDCTRGDGQQVCSAGTWEACECLDDSDDGSGDGDDSGFNCKAGYYVGTFKGDWKPGIGDFPPFGTLIDVTIEASDKPDKPGLALTLEEEAMVGGEFPTYEVKNGCLVGTASSGEGQNHPFIGIITGSLSCETGAFEGHVDGYYELFGDTLGNLSVWKFAGSMNGKFDVATTSIEMGMWDLREKQSTAPDGPGGKAMWNAAWKSAEGPALPPECQALLNANDAGVGTGADGGT